MANVKKAKTKNNGLRLIIMLSVLFVLCVAVLIGLIAAYNKKLQREYELGAVTANDEQVTEPVVSEEASIEESSAVIEIVESSHADDTSVEASDESSKGEADTSKAEDKKASSAADSSSSSAEKTDEKDKSKYDENVTKKLSEMTLHEKVCQMFIVTPEGLTNYSDVTVASENTLYGLQAYPVGGVIYFANNLSDTYQTEQMIASTQEYGNSVNGLPMFIAVDEEGGDVARCADNLGTTALLPMYNYKGDAQAAYDNAYTIAQDISALGFNLDFAPVADTWSNYDNTVIGTRAYSDDFSETAELIPQAVKGFGDGGVYCTLKHFPGHGDTAEDSHYSSACTYKTAEQLENEEYLAFKSGIKAGAPMVMVGHITVPEIDDRPACISSEIIQNELRKKLGFDGVVITDSLCMGAVTNYYSSGELAVLAVEAGVDILLMPEDLASAVYSLEAAVENGTLTEDRIDESVARILKLKLNM